MKAWTRSFPLGLLLIAPFVILYYVIGDFNLVFDIAMIIFGPIFVLQRKQLAREAWRSWPFRYQGSVRSLEMSNPFFGIATFLWGAVSLTMRYLV